jgi:hypothetical protein
MTKTEKNIKSDESTKPSFGLFTSSPKQIQATHTEELVIALCGPVGSPIHKAGKIRKQNNLLLTWFLMLRQKAQQQIPTSSILPRKAIALLGHSMTG